MSCCDSDHAPFRVSYHPYELVLAMVSLYTTWYIYGQRDQTWKVPLKTTERGKTGYWFQLFFCDKKLLKWVSGRHQ